jgi:voltage-gated potassium channel
MKKKFAHLLVNLAYFLQSSKRYQKWRRFFYNVLENDKDQKKKYFDLFMIFLIFLSIFVLIREVKYDIEEWLVFVNYYVISIIFFIEYILRLWVNGSISKIIIAQDEHDTILQRDFQLKKALKEIIALKFSYITKPKAIIDLLAILPFFHELRLLRLFILFRVFKLFRYTKNFTNLLSVLSSKKFEFLTLFIFASVVIFISSVLIYVIEGNNPKSNIHNFFEAIYWSVVTLSTVGFGDITPVTQEGKFISILIIISGVGVLSFSTSLIVTAFSERLDEVKELKIIDNVAKMKQFYLICGYENIAKELVAKLKIKKKYIVVLDDDKDRAERAKKDGLTVLNFSPGSIESYEKKLHLDFKKQVKVVLCLRHDDVANVYTALTVRSIDKDVKILSLLVNDINKKKLLFAGVDEIIYPQELIGMITKELIGQPVAFEAIHALRSENTNVSIEEILITEKMIENFSVVGDIPNKKYRVVLLGIYKKDYDSFWFNPIDSTLLQVGDIILVIGYKVFIKEFEKVLHSSRKVI